MPPYPRSGTSCLVRFEPVFAVQGRLPASPLPTCWPRSRPCWRVKSWTGGATMADASLNRRMTVRLAHAVAFAQIGVVGLDGQIELEALRLYGLPEAAPALLCGTPTLPVGQREFAVETTLDLPSLARRRGAPSRRRRWPAPGRATAPRRRSPHRRASSSSTRSFGRTTRCACWRGTSRAPPSTSARRRCPWRSRSGGSRERRRRRRTARGRRGSPLAAEADEVALQHRHAGRAGCGSPRPCPRSRRGRARTARAHSGRRGAGKVGARSGRPRLAPCCSI